MAQEETEEKPKPHCNICGEIAEGCRAEFDAWKAGTLVKCTVCGNKGLIRSEDGLTATICNLCPRGYRMKLWLKHQVLEEREHPAEIELV